MIINYALVVFSFFIYNMNLNFKDFYIICNLATQLVTKK